MDNTCTKCLECMVLNQGGTTFCQCELEQIVESEDTEPSEISSEKEKVSNCFSCLFPYK